MESKKPVPILALALITFFTGAFILIVNIGTSGRNAGGLHYDFSFGGAAAAATAYFGDFERGSAVIKHKAGALLDNVIGDAATAQPQAPGRTASAKQGRGRDQAEGDDGDSLEKYFKKHYARGYDSGGSDNYQSWSEGDAGGSAPGGSSSAGYEPPARSASAKVPGKAVEESAAVPSPSHGPGFHVPPPGEEPPAAPKLFASLPGKKPAGNARLDPGAQADRGDSPQESAGGARLPKEKGGSVSGMSGAGGAPSLNGAEEKMKGGAQSSYNAKMSGGAAAVAAGGGGASSPAAPAKASDAGTASGSSASGGTAAAKKDKAQTDEGGSFYAAPADVGEDDLVTTVVVDRQNGAEGKFVSAEEGAGDPEEILLQPGAVSGDVDIAKGVPAADALVKDPETYAGLSPERKKELRKDVHAFLKKVENKYGKMTDIYRTSCKTTPDLCKQHEISGNYLTMTTEKKAKLVLGMKYIKQRWQRYTIDFQAPPGEVQPPLPQYEAPPGDVTE